MKLLKEYLANGLAAISICALALSLHGCASGASDNSAIPPTVKVLLETPQPGARVEVNGIQAGETPVSVNLEVSDRGAVLYPYTIRAYPPGSGSNGSRLTIPVGKSPPAKIMFTGAGAPTESREAAPMNPAGTKPTARENVM